LHVRSLIMSNKKLNDIIFKICDIKMSYNFWKHNYVVYAFYMYYYVV